MNEFTSAAAASRRLGAKRSSDNSGASVRKPETNASRSEQRKKADAVESVAILAAFIRNRSSEVL